MLMQLTRLPRPGPVTGSTSESRAISSSGVGMEVVSSVEIWSLVLGYLHHCHPSVHPQLVISLQFMVRGASSVLSTSAAGETSFCSSSCMLGEVLRVTQFSVE